MAENWSRAEVDTIVADYFAMLADEMLDQPFNKSARRRTLSARLDGRSDGSIGRKHQNISAALLDLGAPYVQGYKPLSNYQSLLFDVVAERLDADRDLRRILARDVEQPAPSLEALPVLTLEDAPAPSDAPYEYLAERAKRPAPMARRVDYLEREARNSSLGLAGELLVVSFERNRLLQANQSRLADKVEHTSVAIGDGSGDDVRSFEADGRDRYIEVKTTAYGKSTPFFVSRNEVAVSREIDREYHLLRVFRFRREPRVYSLNGPLDRTCLLDPTHFTARVA